MNLYNWLLILHILAATIWVGGGIMLTFIGAAPAPAPTPALSTSSRRSFLLLASASWCPRWSSF
jgi:uncharacterized membrane protein